MTPYRYPGLFGDPRTGRLWPAIVFSVVLHIALLWSFSRFHIGHIDEIFYSPIQMVELRERGPGMSGARLAEGSRVPAPTSAPAPPAPPPEPESQPKEEPKLESKPLREPPKVQAKVQPPAQEAPPKPLAPEPLPATPTGPKIEVPQRQAAVKPEPPSKSQASSEPQKARTPPPPKPTDEGRALEVRRKLEEQRESSLRSRIASMKEEVRSPSREAPSSGLGDIRARLRGGQPAQGSPGGGDGAGSGPVRGAGQLLDVRMRNYIDGIWDQIRQNWSIPPDTEGKGYLAVVEVVLDRRGKLLKSRLEQTSGNALYDRAAMRAVQMASSKGLPSMPPNAGEDEFVFGFRFRE